MLLYPFIPSLFPPLCPQVSSLCLGLYTFPANRFINTIFSRFHIYVLTYAICFSLSDLLHSVITGSRFIHLSRTDSNLFFFMADISLYTCTTISVSIHLSMDINCFHVLAFINSVAVDSGLHVLFSIMVFSGYMPSSGITGSYSSFIPSF